jgi:hypothetical protein
MMTVKEMKARLAEAGYTVRSYRGRHLILDEDGFPVHPTDRPDRLPYTETTDDLRFWVFRLCRPKRGAA